MFFRMRLGVFTRFSHVFATFIRPGPFMSVRLLLCHWPQRAGDFVHGTAPEKNSPELPGPNFSILEQI